MNSIQELIDFAESIPEDQWITEKFCENGDTSTIKQKACFLGHLNFHLTGDYMNGLCWGELIPSSKAGELMERFGLAGQDLKAYNNGTFGTIRYGETPKARIKSFLASKLT